MTSFEGQIVGMGTRTPKLQARNTCTIEAGILETLPEILNTISLEALQPGPLKLKSPGPKKELKTEHLHIEAPLL